MPDPIWSHIHVQVQALAIWSHLGMLTELMMLSHMLTVKTVPQPLFIAIR